MSCSARNFLGLQRVPIVPQRHGNVAPRAFSCRMAASELCKKRVDQFADDDAMITPLEQSRGALSIQAAAGVCAIFLPWNIACGTK